MNNEEPATELRIEFPNHFHSSFVPYWFGEVFQMVAFSVGHVDLALIYLEVDIRSCSCQFQGGKQHKPR